MVMMKALFLAFGLFGLVVSAACASAQAKAPVERPNLETPEPPPRVIEPGQHELVPPEPVSELPPGDQLPAAPLLIAAYAFVWVATMVYVWTVWRRLNRVETEMRALSQKTTHR